MPPTRFHCCCIVCMASVDVNPPFPSHPRYRGSGNDDVPPEAYPQIFFFYDGIHESGYD